MLHNNEHSVADSENRQDNRNDRTPGAGNRIADVRTTDTETFYNGLDGGGSGGGQYETFAEEHGQRGARPDAGQQQVHGGPGGQRATQNRPGQQNPSVGADRQRGSNKGRGPKGYRRSDARIADDIHVALAQDDSLDASDIEVTVTDGEVNLRGSVDSRAAKRHAADLVEDVHGVTHVGNSIRIAKSGDDRDGGQQGERAVM